MYPTPFKSYPQFSYKKVETKGLFELINPNYKAFANLLEKNKLLNEEIRGIIFLHKIQLVRVFEVT